MNAIGLHNLNLNMNASDECLWNVDTVYHASLRFSNCRPMVEWDGPVGPLGEWLIDTVLFTRHYLDCCPPTSVTCAHGGTLILLVCTWMITCCFQSHFPAHKWGRRVFAYSGPLASNMLQEAWKLSELISFIAFTSRLRAFETNSSYCNCSSYDCSNIWVWISES